MTLNNAILTNAGNTLLAKVTAGATLKFTRIATDDTVYSPSAIPALTALTNQRQTSLLSSVTRSGNNAVVTAMFSNAGLAAPYTMNAFALFANDPVVGEILFAVTTASTADTMPADGGGTPYAVIMNWTIVVSGTTTVNTTVDSAAFATQAQVAAKAQVVSVGTYGGLAAVDSGGVNIFPIQLASDINTMYFEYDAATKTLRLKGTGGGGTGTWDYVSGSDEFFTISDTTGGSGSGSGSGSGGTASITLKGNNRAVGLYSGNIYRAVVAYGRVVYYPKNGSNPITANATSGIGRPGAGGSAQYDDYRRVEVQFTVTGSVVSFTTAQITVATVPTTLTLTGTYVNNTLTVTSASASNGQTSSTVTLCGIKVLTQ